MGSTGVCGKSLTQIIPPPPKTHNYFSFCLSSIEDNRIQEVNTHRPKSIDMTLFVNLNVK